eukprot:ANDGO_05181.mRNA.1 E3 ubiquitin-protein ligase RHF1A
MNDTQMGASCGRAKGTNKSGSGHFSCGSSRLQAHKRRSFLPSPNRVHLSVFSGPFFLDSLSYLILHSSTQHRMKDSIQTAEEPFVVMCSDPCRKQLSPDILDVSSAPKRTPDKNASCDSLSEDICAVCWDSYVVDNPSCEFVCGHKFHLQCALEWQLRQPTCPMCMEPLREAGTQALPLVSTTKAAKLANPRAATDARPREFMKRVRESFRIFFAKFS